MAWILIAWFWKKRIVFFYTTTLYSNCFTSPEPTPRMSTSTNILTQQYLRSQSQQQPRVPQNTRKVQSSYQTSQTITPSYPRSRSYDEEDTLVQTRIQRPVSYGQLPTQEFLLRNVQGSNATKDQPRFLKKLPSVMQRQAGQPLKLEFEMNELPECHIRWFKDSRQVQNTPQTRVNSTFGVHTLIIPRLTPEDSGLYKVIVETPLGNMDTSCDVVVEGVILLPFFFPFYFVLFCLMMNFKTWIPEKVFFCWHVM